MKKRSTTTRMLSAKTAAVIPNARCPHCLTYFGPRQTPKGHWYITTYCSKSCAKYHTAPARPEQKCVFCGVGFQRPAGSGARKYCSKVCSERAFAVPKWKRRSHGYVTIWTGKAEVQVHRILMEQHLGRPLTGTETVHHINGIRDDNRVENFELWDHAQPHGQRVADKLKWCVEYLAAHRYVALTDKGPALILAPPLES